MSGQESSGKKSAASKAPHDINKNKHIYACYVVFMYSYLCSINISQNHHCHFRDENQQKNDDKLQITVQDVRHTDGTHTGLFKLLTL